MKAVYLLALVLVGSGIASARRIQGSILLTDNSPAEGATVTASDGTRNFSGTTLSTGTFTIELPPGTYEVRVAKPGFESPPPRQVTVPDIPDGHFFYAALTPVLAAGNVTVTGITDTFAQTPGYVPDSGISRTGLFNVYGSFPVNGDVAADGAWPETLNGVSINIIDSSGAFVTAPLLYYAGRNQITGYLPENIPADRYRFVVKADGKDSQLFAVTVDDPRPNIATIQQTGTGPGVFTQADFSVVTHQNPARPNGLVTAWTSIFGSRPNGSPVNIVDRRGTNEFHGDAFFRLGNKRYGNEFISYAGASGVPGLGQWNLRIPEDAPEGCDVPIQLEYQRNGGPVIRGNQVRIPISRSGTCADALGFNATEVSQFPRTTMEALVSENTFLGASRRDVIQSTLTATTWTDSTYVAPPPVNTWGYRWEPANYTNPFAPARGQLGGTSTLTLPWGVFSYSPASNGGPYSLLFAFPSQFREGSFTMDYGSGFTVNQQSFNLRFTASYQRTAGPIRETAINRFPLLRDDHTVIRGGYAIYYDRFLDTILESSTAADALLLDVNIVADNYTGGRHVIRGILDPQQRSPAVLESLDAVLSKIPNQVNRLDMVYRFLPRNNIFQPHTSSVVQRSNVTFDSAIILQDLPRVR